MVNGNISKIKAEIKAGQEPEAPHSSKDPSGRMSVQNIVKNSKEAKLINPDWKKTYAAISQLLETNEYRMFRTGDTLFLIQIVQPGECNLEIINADKEKNLHKNVVELIKALKKSNYKTVHMTTQNQDIISTIQESGCVVQPSQDQPSTYTVAVQ